MSLSTYESAVARLTKEHADLQKRSGQEHDKIARLSGDLASLQRSLTSSSSQSTRLSKQSQVASKEKDLAQARKKLAEVVAKMSSKTGDLNRALQNLRKAQEQERKHQDSADKKRRDGELRHVKEVAKQTERQQRIHAELRRSPLVINLAKLPSKIKVLFFAANPLDAPQLRLDEEVRAITAKIRASAYRDSVELISVWATRTGDLLQELNQHRPHIVHFSGHGSADGEIIFVDPSGNAKPVVKEAIVQVMNTMSDNIRVVVFNACFSSGQAESVTRHVDAAIGMNDAIGDEAARVFAAQFYSAIGFGLSVEQAFNQAKAALMLEGIPEENTPEMFTREGVAAGDIVLVRPEGVVGDDTTETVYDSAIRLSRQLSYKSFRSGWRSSQGVTEAELELQTLFAEMDRIAAAITASPEGLRIEPRPGSQHTHVLNTSSNSMSASWGRTYSNTLDYSGLRMAIFDRPASMPHMNEVIFRLPKIVREKHYDADVDSSRRVGWREKEGRKQFHTSTELAELWIKQTIEQMQAKHGFENVSEGSGDYDEDDY